MATVDINAVAATRASSPTATPRERAQQRLGQLVASLEAVASRIDAGDTSQTERTVLRTRFNDLQRQVNRLDGIVAGEGLEARGQNRINQATQMGSGNQAPARPSNDQDRVEIAQANVEAAAPPPPQAASTEGVDLVV